MCVCTCACAVQVGGYVYLCAWVHMCACGGQQTTVGMAPHVLTLLAGVRKYLRQHRVHVLGWEHSGEALTLTHGQAKEACWRKKGVVVKSQMRAGTHGWAYMHCFPTTRNAFLFSCPVASRDMWVSSEDVLQNTCLTSVHSRVLSAPIPAASCL